MVIALSVLVFVCPLLCRPPSSPQSATLEWSGVECPKINYTYALANSIFMYPERREGWCWTDRTSSMAMPVTSPSLRPSVGTNYVYLGGDI